MALRSTWLALLLAGTGAACGDGSTTAAVEDVPPFSGTARITLMALGTHDSYAVDTTARFALLIVSPETEPGSVLARARDAHPHTPVFAYLNTMDVMLSRSRESADFWRAREDWFLHDDAGERVRVRVHTHQGERARYGMNVGHPGWQAYLAARVIQLLEAGYEGIQLDNVETSYSYLPRYIGNWVSAVPVDMTESRWYEAEVELLTAIRAAADAAGFADRELIFNHIRAGEPERSMAFLAPVEGANSEGWMNSEVVAEGRWGWLSRVELLRRAAAAGKRTNPLALAADKPNVSEASFAFASYLMAYRDERSTFWYGDLYRAHAMTWYPFYDVDLGPPVADMAQLEGSGVYARAFEGGVVLVNPTDIPQRISPPDAWPSLELGEVTVGSKEGRILMWEDQP
jgi:hypothetical protein